MEMVRMNVVKNKFKRPGKMKPVCHYNSRVVFVYFDNNPFSGCNRVYFFIVNNDPDPQQTEQKIFLTGNNNMVFYINKNYLSERMIWIKSFAINDAPPTSPPSTSGQANNSAALFAFTLPPYNIGISFALSLPY